MKEQNYLEYLLKVASSPESSFKKYKAVSTVLLVLGFAIGLSTQIYSGIFPSSEINTGLYILAGCFIGFGWCQSIGIRALPYLFNHINKSSIEDRLHQINNT